MPLDSRREQAKVVIAVGAAFTLFALMLLSAILPGYRVETSTVYVLLGLLGIMLGVETIPGRNGK